MKKKKEKKKLKRKLNWSKKKKVEQNQSEKFYVFLVFWLFFFFFFFFIFIPLFLRLFCPNLFIRIKYSLLKSLWFSYFCFFSFLFALPCISPIKKKKCFCFNVRCLSLTMFTHLYKHKQINNNNKKCKWKKS